jgi:hypothetical protein
MQDVQLEVVNVEECVYPTSQEGIRQTMAHDRIWRFQIEDVLSKAADMPTRKNKDGLRSVSF